jgi:hypothetical protein
MKGDDSLKVRRIIVVLVLVILLLSVAVTCHAQQESVKRIIAPSIAPGASGGFVGTWINEDPDTRGITRLVISNGPRRDELTIRAFGKAHPSDIDWGESLLHLYGTSVEDPNYQYATTIYEDRSSTRMLTLELEGTNVIRIVRYSRFPSSDSRHNFRQVEYFRRSAGGQGGAQPPSSTSPLPDLIVESVEEPEWDKARNKTVIRAVIRNIGNARAAASYAKLKDQGEDGGGPVAEVPALASGAYYVTTFELPYWVFRPDANFWVKADYTNKVKESNEDNNMLTFFREW